MSRRPRARRVALAVMLTTTTTLPFTGCGPGSGEPLCYVWASIVSGTSGYEACRGAGGADFARYRRDLEEYLALAEAADPLSPGRPPIDTFMEARYADWQARKASLRAAHAARHGR